MFSRAYKAAVALPPVLWVTVFLLVPYLLMFCYSFWSVSPSQTIVHSWNLENYTELLRVDVYWQTLLRSMWIAARVTVFSLLLGYPLGYFLSFYAGKKKDLLYQLVIIPLWVSYLVRAYAWKTILGSDGVLNTLLQYLHVTKHPLEFLLYSPFAVVLTLTHIYTPFAFLPIYAALEHIPRNLVEASQDLGATPRQTFWRVIVPLSIPGVVAGATFAFVLSHSGSRWLLLHAVAVFAFLYLPIAVLILYSFNGEGVGGFPPHHLTLDWYRILFADGPIWDSVLNSLQVALAAMAISLIFGVPAALALERAQFPGKALFRRLVLLPLILPGIITGLSLLMLFNVMGTKLSLMTIILGHGTALISVATTEVFAGLQKLDRAQEEASLDLGANYWQTFWRITVPNLKLPIIGAALLIFTLSMDEIAVSFFLIGRDNTLPLEIWGRLRRGITPEINAVSTIIFLFSLVAIMLWYRLRMRGEGRSDVGAEIVQAVEGNAG
jgi:ABC-type spermidine/putrescine transport system permease subunit II